MDTNQERAALVGTALIVGYVVGARVTRKAIGRRLTQKRDLIVNGINYALHRAQNEDMTEREFAELLHSELEFIRIVSY